MTGNQLGLRLHKSEQYPVLGFSMCCVSTDVTSENQPPHLSYRIICIVCTHIHDQWQWLQSESIYNMDGKVTYTDQVTDVLYQLNCQQLEDWWLTSRCTGLLNSLEIKITLSPTWKDQIKPMLCVLKLDDLAYMITVDTKWECKKWKSQQLKLKTCKGDDHF